MSKRLNFLFLILFLFPNFLLSSIWVEAKDELKVKKIEYFSIINGLNINTTSYPISLKKINSPKHNKTVSIGVLTQYKNLTNKILENKRNSTLSFSYFSETSPIKNIGDDWGGESFYSIKSSFYKNNFASSLNIHYEKNEFNEKKYYLDNSYVSFAKWNNAIGFGFINRWWGPTHNNNLILSNYSRPSPGIFFDSLKPVKFDNFLSLIGTIDYTIFINRLEKNRYIKNPYLVGTRVSVSPIDNLFLGFSRTITIGGEGRREGLSTFSKAFFGAFEAADNPGVSSANKDGYNYSNQLAGYDIKYDFLIKNSIVSVYWQEIAEDGDTSATSPFSGYMYTFGSEIKFQLDGLLRSFSIEFSRTVLDRHNSPGRNTAYEHWIYKSGYRYRGLPIGAFIDTDSKYTQISYVHEINEVQNLETSFFYFEPNLDANGRSIWGNSGDEFHGLKGKYNFQITSNIKGSVILTISDKELSFLNKELDKNILGLSAEYSF